MAEQLRVKRTIKSSANKVKVITIGEAFKEFITEKTADGVVPKTLRNYSKTLEKFETFSGFDSNTDIKQVEKAKVLDWVNFMKETKANGGNGLSAASTNHYIRDFRSFLYWCMNDERAYLPSYKLQETSAQETPPKTFSQADLKKLLQKPKDRGDMDFVEWRNWAVVSLALDMGARAGTITDIQIQDLNFSNNTIYLRHTKNKKLTHMKISSAGAKALKEYISLYRDGAEDEEYLFCNVGGEQLTYNALSHSFRKYCADRGVYQYNLHGLRHSFATAFAENTGGDMVKLQKALGHKSIAMAQKYVDLTNVSMGNYDDISPLKSTSSSNKGKPSRKIKRTN